MSHLQISHEIQSLPKQIYVTEANIVYAERAYLEENAIEKSKIILELNSISSSYFIFIYRFSNKPSISSQS